MKYLLMNRTAGFIGNSPLFWKVGGCGYTPWVDYAQRFTSEEADSLSRASSGTHVFEKVPVELVKHIAKLTVDIQELNEELTKMKSDYGTCPHCGGSIVSRERRPNGNDKCENGHVFPSSAAVKGVSA